MSAPPLSSKPKASADVGPRVRRPASADAFGLPLNRLHLRSITTTARNPSGRNVSDAVMSRNPPIRRARGGPVLGPDANHAVGVRPGVRRGRLFGEGVEVVDHFGLVGNVESFADASDVRAPRERAELGVERPHRVAPARGEMMKLVR